MFQLQKSNSYSIVPDSHPASPHSDCFTHSRPLPPIALVPTHWPLELDNPDFLILILLTALCIEVLVSFREGLKLWFSFSQVDSIVRILYHALNLLLNQSSKALAETPSEENESCSIQCKPDCRNKACFANSKIEPRERVIEVKVVVGIHEKVVESKVVNVLSNGNSEESNDWCKVRRDSCCCSRQRATEVACCEHLVCKGKGCTLDRLVCCWNNGEAKEDISPEADGANGYEEEKHGI